MTVTHGPGRVSSLDNKMGGLEESKKGGEEREGGGVEGDGRRERKKKGRGGVEGDGEREWREREGITAGAGIIKNHILMELITSGS